MDWFVRLLVFLSIAVYLALALVSIFQDPPVKQCHPYSTHWRWVKSAYG